MNPIPPTVPDDQIVAVATKFMLLAHQGQFRRGGVVPYATHPEAVAAAFTDPIDIAVAKLHDTLELDCAYTLTPLDLQMAGLPWEVFDGVLTLTRRVHEEYADYIQRIKEHRDGRWVAHKVADIHANLADDPTETQRTKYRAALDVLLPS